MSELIDKEALITKLLTLPGVGSNSDALEVIKRFPSYELQQPVVPTCAESWLEQAQYSTDVIDLFSEVEYATDSDGFISKHWRWSPEFYDWLCDDADTLYLLCDALRYGYEVEKEPLYYVKLPVAYFNHWDLEAYLMKDGRGNITIADNDDFDDMKFTESEIKAHDERYWPFAVPVEEVVEG
ncbi:hypothetical protein D920_00095 [Enterococcus faecalis 13-SD-W-01]|nr:hypothetical protein D920_00095 [Enterococcus faecalis 13-SD-W-01]